VAPSRRGLDRIVELGPLEIVPAGDSGEPCRVLEIPAHRAREPRFEAFTWLPGEFAGDFARVDRVAPVVTGPVPDKRDLRGIVATGLELSQDAAQRAHHIDVGPFRFASDVVGLPGPTPLQHGAYGRTVVADIEPIANIAAVAV